MPGILEKTKTISVIEAHSLWGLLSAKYHMQDNLNFWLLHVHDRDLKKIMLAFVKDLNEHTSLLENKLKQYSIEAPCRARRHTGANVNAEIITDEIIGVNYFTFLQGMVENVLFAIQTSTVNDDMNNFFNRFAKHVIEQSDAILKYLKIKGWLDIPPNYANIPSGTGERLDCIEVYHLWAHTYYRYGNLEENLKWIEFVHDPEFRMILEKGGNKLKQQIAMLENELEHFGLPLPKKPPAVVKTNQDKQIFQDKSIYKTLYIGIQWAGVLHAKAYNNCTTNDRVRKIFKDLLYDEIRMVQQISRYGKVKGWLETPPQYAG